MAKRGFVYTLFAIAMVASVMMLLSLQSAYRPEIHVAEKIRSDEMTYLEGGIISDLGRGVYISGKRAVLTLVNSTIETGVYNNTANESLKDIMVTGKYSNTNASLMRSSAMTDWSNAITTLAVSLGYNANISLLSINISEKDAFNLDVWAVERVLLIDRRLSMQLDRNGSFDAQIGIDSVEDPFVSISSAGYARQKITKCSYATGTDGTGGWAWGRTYINLTKTDFGDVPGKNKTILIVASLAGKTNYLGFAAIVSETPGDVALGANISGVSGATTLKNNSPAVKQNRTLWLTNITTEPVNSCYFETPYGPSFLDRLEGTKTLSQKYSLPGINTGIGSFIYVPGLPPAMQKGSDNYAIDYQYFA